MLPAKYSHLKIQLLKEDFKYVLLPSSSSFSKSIESLSSQKFDFCTFSFKGEFSLICPTEALLEDISKNQEGWSAMKIIGEMPFGSVQGLIANISSALFSENVGVCIISTFQTDLFFLKKENIRKAKEALSLAGWEILNEA